MTTTLSVRLESVPLEVVSDLAASILTAHEEANDAAVDAAGMIDDAVQKRRYAAALVDAYRAENGLAFTDKLRNEIGMPPEVAKAYITIHKTRDRLIDQKQLQLFCLLGMAEDEDKEQHQEQTPDPWAWVKAAARMKSLISLDDIDAMDRTALEVAQLNLVPIKAVIDEIERRLAQ